MHLGSGLWVCAKRLERRTFGWPSGEESARDLRPEELQLLLHGLEATPRRNWGSFPPFFSFRVHFSLHSNFPFCLTRLMSLAKEAAVVLPPSGPSEGSGRNRSVGPWRLRRTWFSWTSSQGPGSRSPTCRLYIQVIQWRPVELPLTQGYDGLSYWSAAIGGVSPRPPAEDED